MELTYKFGTDGLVSETRSESVVFENFESLKMNLMAGGAEDLSSFTVVPNPDPSGLNLSGYVVEFLRDKDGVAWGGFYATLDTPVDFTTNKYVHAKVWKSRISPVKFKIEGGSTGNIEVPSMYPQTVENGWEDMVFDFSAATGPYSKIVFMPDFNDPVGLDGDITIYFDDFVLNNQATPIEIAKQVINVDMSASGMTAGKPVWISGALGGVYGSWAEPGSIAGNEMLDPDGDGVYSIELQLPDGVVAFKFFWDNGWGNGDNAVADRSYTVNGSTNLDFVWGVAGYTETTSTQEISGTSFKVYPNPVTDKLTVQSLDMKKLTVSDLLGRTLKTYKLQNESSKVIDMNSLRSGIYFISIETGKGTYTSKFIKK